LLHMLRSVAHFSNPLHCGDYVRLGRHLHRRGRHLVVIWLICDYRRR